MKVCFIGKNLAIGGGKDGFGGYRRFVFELVTNLAPNLDGVLLLGEKISGFPNEIRKIEGVGLNLNFIKNFFKIRSEVKKYDLIHALDSWPCGLIGYMLSIGLKKKLVITAIGTSAVKPFSSYLKGFLLSLSYKKASVVTAISRFTSNKILEKLPKLKIEVINPGVNSAFLDQSNAHTCNLQIFNQIEKYRPYILSVGDIRDRKGYHVSIEAYGRVLQDFPDLKYLAVGFKKDDYGRKIDELVKNKKLEDKVVFLSDINDDLLKEIYAHAELFWLLPININNDFEGFGLVFLEAAANGLPSITTRGNGSEDAVVEGETGLFVAQNNVQEAATVLKKILTAKETPSFYGENARKFAGKMSWDNAVKKYVEIYKAL